MRRRPLQAGTLEDPRERRLKCSHAVAYWIVRLRGRRYRADECVAGNPHSPVGSPLHLRMRGVTIGCARGRCRALICSSAELPPGVVHLSALRAGIRHLQPCLPPDEGGARLHAAAGSSADRGLYAAGMAGALHRREYRAAPRPPISTGPTSSLVSGMHVQAPQIHDIARARPCGRQGRDARRAIGIGRAGDVSGHRLSPHRRDRRRNRRAHRASRREHRAARPRRCGSRPGAACRSSDFPIPAYDLIPLKQLSDAARLQFSSGCPYRCEFCDIPGLYGRQPRLKTPAQITAELDAMRRQTGHPPVVYFVDDNFIGNRKAAHDMLPHLVAWQKAARLSAAVRLRGDAQHRQADRRFSR